MLIIAHRGCTEGPDEKENEPNFIDEALKKFYCEIDLWKIQDSLFLGHDYPKYKITENWLQNRQKKLLVHCKNIAALSYIENAQKEQYVRYHYFWHEEDKYTLTSQNIVLAYPGYSCPSGGIAMKCEHWPSIESGWFGICSDFVQSFDPDKDAQLGPYTKRLISLMDRYYLKQFGFSICKSE